MFIYLRVLKESFRFAVNALRNNKLRTFLSLMGVTVGIFSIIGVLAAVDSLEREIKGSLSSLDQNTMILCHVSFGPTDVPRWKREQFPDVTYEEYQMIHRSSRSPSPGSCSCRCLKISWTTKMKSTRRTDFNQ